MARAGSIVALLAAVAGAVPADIQEPGTRASFATWLEGARKDALTRGIGEATIFRALGVLAPLPIIVEHDRMQAQRVRTVDEYVKRRLTSKFVQTANDCARAERASLHKVIARYGVQPRFLVAVWKPEPKFGRFSGVRPVQALATPAWVGRRDGPDAARAVALLEACRGLRQRWRGRHLAVHPRRAGLDRGLPGRLWVEGR